MSKVYISVLDEVPDYIVPTLVAHAILGYHLSNSSEEYSDWLAKSFRKVTLKVNRKEFDKIALLPTTGLFHENKTLEGIKSCAVTLVNEEVPNVLKFAKMWKPVI